MSTRLVWIAAIATAAFATASEAQTPRIANGTITSRAASQLAQTFRSAVDAQADVGWVGYAVPVVDGDRMMCCSGTRWRNDVMVSGGNSCCDMCRIEPAAQTASPANPGKTPPAAGPIKLEGSSHMVVLVRVVARQVDRVRTFSADCDLDAGGRPVTWLTDVRPPDSIALLESLVQGQPDPRDRIADSAIAAIALHQDAAADAALERLLAPTQPAAVRAKVPFWLGNARGRRGLDTLQRVVKEDSSNEVRKKAIFGISQSREPSAVEALIDHARRHTDAAVRGEAIFWLAQRAGSKAAGAITERIEQDPDTEVKKRAVFALSQLPKDEGVPLLIRIARTHSNPAVKKQAIFWLGQSKDTRALDYFAEILAK